jgi:ribokinase
MNDKQILVIGSVNIDHLMFVPKHPRPGETILASEYYTAFGGKGANQAVACARLGGRTTFIANVGSDLIGSEMVARFSKDGIDTSLIKKVESEKTGVALIMIDPGGENIIGISTGANATLDTNRIIAQEHKIADADFLLMQLETPLESISAAAGLAKKYRTKVVLNPAPAIQLPDEILVNVDIITPNQTEAEILTGVSVVDLETARQAARVLHGKGITTVIITMGDAGAFYSDADESIIVHAVKVDPVDTTAAGDTFNGALLVGLSRGLSGVEVVDFANRCAAISVTRVGAQPSIPYLNEVQG